METRPGGLVSRWWERWFSLASTVTVPVLGHCLVEMKEDLFKATGTQGVDPMQSLADGITRLIRDAKSASFPGAEWITGLRQQIEACDDAIDADAKQLMRDGLEVAARESEAKRLHLLAETICSVCAQEGIQIFAQEPNPKRKRRRVLSTEDKQRQMSRLFAVLQKAGDQGLSRRQLSEALNVSLDEIRRLMRLSDVVARLARVGNGRLTRYRLKSD